MHFDCSLKRDFTDPKCSQSDFLASQNLSIAEFYVGINNNIEKVLWDGK